MVSRQVPRTRLRRWADETVDLLGMNRRSESNARRLIVIAVDPQTAIGPGIGPFHDDSRRVVDRMRQTSVRVCTKRDGNAAVEAIERDALERQVVSFDAGATLSPRELLNRDQPSFMLPAEAIEEGRPFGRGDVVGVHGSCVRRLVGHSADGYVSGASVVVHGAVRSSGSTAVV